MFFDWTYLLMLPGLILGLYAQSKVKRNYEKYSRVFARLGIPASEMVQRLLRSNGITDVGVMRVGGDLTDHYDPRNNTLSLSDGVYDSASIAAYGIAAHEAGHAMQKAQNDGFLALRSAVVPVVNIGSALSWPLFLIGLIFSYDKLCVAGIILFSAVLLFALITLPVEFGASRRAKEMLLSGGFLSQDEMTGVSAVLDAAALTYVASFVTALLQMLRLIMILNSRRRD